jgi:hypothetical protein
MNMTMVETAHQFKQALRTGRPGDKIIYHTGHLLWDRIKSTKVEALTLHELGNAAWKAYKEDRVSLVQRRLSHPWGSEYIAEVR